MFGAHPPSVLLFNSLHPLLGHLAGVREGSEEAIHQTRVSVRRVRELLALARTDFKDDELAAIEERLADAMHALSRARDADVALRLVQNVESRFPLAPGVLGRLREAVIAAQDKTRRKAIKKLEALDLEALPEQFEHAADRRIGRVTGRTAWRASLRRQVATRAAKVRSAIEHAGGVYFPNRLHSARVAIKRLRYTLELADQTGTSRARDEVRLLKKVQGRLGDVHDREVLLARLEDLSEAGVKLDDEEVRAVETFIRADIRVLHAKYADRRADLLAVCDACVSAARQSRTRTSALVAVGIAVPSLLLLRQRALSARAPESTRARVQADVA